jgi:hypothetical protein
MILIENQVARLLEILKKGKTIKPNTSCIEAWRTLLETKDQIILLPRLAKIMELPGQIIESFNSLGINDESIKTTNSYWHGQVNSGFSNQKIDGTWDTFISQIDIHAINYLSLASGFFVMHSNVNQNLPTQELSEIKQSLQTSLDSVLKNDELDKDIRRYLVRSLQRIILAIDEYFISGYTPIIEAIETTIGYAALDSKTDEKKFVSAFYDTGVAKEFFTALNIISAMVTLATGVPQLSSDWVHLLPFVKN